MAFDGIWILCRCRRLPLAWNLASSAVDRPIREARAAGPAMFATRLDALWSQKPPAFSCRGDLHGCQLDVYYSLCVAWDSLGTESNSQLVMMTMILALVMFFDWWTAFLGQQMFERVLQRNATCRRFRLGYWPVGSASKLLMKPCSLGMINSH